MVADLVEARAAATSLDDVFLRLADAGIMHRINANASLPRRLGARDAAQRPERRAQPPQPRRLPGRLDLTDGSVAIADDALIVDCAADGLKLEPLVPIWGPEPITLQLIRAGFPCFGAALAGYVEPTRGDDATKNRLGPPSSLGSTREN